MEEVLVFDSLAEAKNQTVELEKLYFIKGESMNLTKLTEHWDESDATSLDDEVKKTPLYQDGILVRVTDDKVKFYYLGGGRALCTKPPYSVAVKSILG
jgi:hypothetical protein